MTIWRPQRDSNPCLSLERAISWASGRWGRRRGASQDRAGRGFTQKVTPADFRRRSACQYRPKSRDPTTQAARTSRGNRPGRAGSLAGAWTVRVVHVRDDQPASAWRPLQCEGERTNIRSLPISVAADDIADRALGGVRDRTQQERTAISGIVFLILPRPLIGGRRGESTKPSSTNNLASPAASPRRHAAS